MIRRGDDYNLACSGIVDPEQYGRTTQYHLYDMALETIIRHYGRPKALVTGCQVGVDTTFVDYYIEVGRQPDVKVKLIVPSAPHNQEFVARMRARGPRLTDVIWAPNGRNNANAYMKRNDVVAEEGDLLAAFPLEPQEVLRSGTWATIRRFRKLDKPVTITPFLEV